MTQTYEILRLGHQGDGIAEGPLFAPRTLPGEVVTGDVEGASLANVKIVTPSDARIKPLCPAYQRCGGCALHHAKPDFVEGWKADVVATALKHQGLPSDIRKVHTSPSHSRRRAKLSGRRMKKGAVVGFMGRASDQVQNIDGCTVLADEIMALRPHLETFTQEFGSRKTTVEFWILSTQTGIDVAVEGVMGDISKETLKLADWGLATGLARLTIAGETLFEWTKPVIQFGDIRVSPPAKAFTQATLAGERALQDAVKEAVSGAQTVVDLFAGSGTLSLPIAHLCPVHAVESDKALLEALDHAVRFAKGLKRVTQEARDLFRNPILAEDFKPFDAAIIDPPRAGGEAQVAQVAESGISRVAMVSCNPVTFARDMQLLVDAGFAIDWVDVVDQFRWSSHVEMVAALSRSTKSDATLNLTKL